MKKECIICKLGIDTNGEYVELKQYDREGKLFKTMYFHLNCYRDEFILQKKQSMAMLNNVNKLMERFQ